MIDIKELKALAEAATPGPWGYNGNCGFRVWSTPLDCYVFDTGTQPDAEFVAAANPAAVLELIAEIERLRDSHQQVCENYNKVSYASEERGRQIDQLKAENELLRRLASEIGLELRKASSWICREVEDGTRSATHWAVRLREKADQIDAALSRESTHD
ncbi:ead/Ea22-like family protein [Pseudomonas sp. NPDC090202]|uniref:ead/Ea22-like family protein n=1 Tax=Pseudomonas sp. NPDC090202 TaxID=3364476 RepID=UPI00381DB73A